MSRSHKKRCGGCDHWQKVTGINGSKFGLCNLEDMRCNSDHQCSKWSAIPYKRTKVDNNIIFIV